MVPGDTLWGIAERFTDSPWRWGDIWNLNRDQLRSPHRIFPGNVIVLDRARGLLTVAADTVKLSPRVRVEPVPREAVPSIPPGVIEPFLSRPMVVEENGLERAPAIIATEANRVILEPGNIAYVSGLGNTREDTWFVYRRGDALIDPETRQTLGFEAVYLGSARVVRAGDPAAVEIITAVQEISRGDRLIAAGQPPVLNYAPRPPEAKIEGRVMSIYGSVGRIGEAGRHSVVTLNRGRRHGLDIGHVLALFTPGEEAVEEIWRGPVGRTLRVPSQRYGVAFVFRVFDGVSYALIMNATRPVNPSDIVRNP